MKWRAMLLLHLCLCGTTLAANIDAVRSCRDKMLPPFPPSTRELLVIIDQTTPLSPALQQLVADSIRPLLVAGSSFSIAVFSAYTQDHYADVLAAGTLEAGLPSEARDDVAKPLLLKLDLCRRRQPQQAAQAAGQALRAAYLGTSGEIARSDILASLKALSSVIGRSTAPEKIVLIASDMLENSSVANFYADRGRAVRKLAAAKELRGVEDKRLLADFGGARVYVIGAGLLAGEAAFKHSYRDPQTMQALHAFWDEYFTRSNARLVEFGQPALLNPVR
ncbi:hypothetical protein [Duganella aceris]|uniref:VWA domain-containing protein n=1 Tax=Duganella aceris TaxID=2703883 RepID=A0ABX0FNQ9_9BURK|nr:hypothetical protein [Duganella aceris]NGZ86128.1 hypothetical protein [Duganella aceris]